eukprot:g4004.t1
MHVDPSDSMESLARDVSARLGLDGGFTVRLSRDRRGGSAYDKPSASIRRVGLKNGDSVFATVITVDEAGVTEREGVKQEQDGGGKDDDLPTNGAAPSSGNLHACLEPSDDGQHCRKFLVNGNIVPSAPTLAGRIVQRARARRQSGTGTAAFTERTPLTQKEAERYESWNDYVTARGGDVVEPRRLKRTRLNRRGANTLPDTITVKRQPYRHVDRIVLANDTELRQFAASWLSSRRQHIGFLFGTYETPDCGISSACIEAIYEPPQERGIYGAQLSDVDQNATMVNRVSKLLGLQLLGWIFTHAPREELLTCAEIRAAAQYQNNNLTSNNIGGQRSRFVTLTLSTDTSGAICPRGFMVSEQGMHLEEDDVLREIKDRPDLMSIQNPGKGFVFPIVIADTSRALLDGNHMASEHMDKAQKMPNQSFPAELLLVHLDVISGSVRDLKSKHDRKVGIFCSNSNRNPYLAFPVENRGRRVPDDSANVGIVRQYLQKALSLSPRPSLDTILNDFHLLIQLPSVFGFELTSRICRELVSEQPLSKHTRQLVDAFVSEKV